MSRPYPNDQLVLVVCEVRYPFLPSGLPRDLWPKVHGPLEELLPVMDAVTRPVQSGDGVTIDNDVAPRFRNREHTKAVTIGRGHTHIETSDYPGWEQFRALIAATLHTVQQHVRPSALVRLGLRYIDEIRVESLDQPTDWYQYLDHSLMAPAPANLVPETWQGLAAYRTGEATRLVLRYGPREGSAIDTERGALRRVRSDGHGPFFLLDTDSFWESQDYSPEFDYDEAMSIAEELHSPIRDVFEGLITDRLRKEVLFDGE